MKTALLCFTLTLASLTAVYLVGSSVPRAAQTRTPVSTAKPTEIDDVEEKLARIREIEAAHQRQTRASNEQIHRENMALENDIADLQGKPRPYPNLGQLRKRKRKPAQESALADLDFMQLTMDCTDALLQKHNRLHPDRPKEELGDMRKSMFGESGPLDADVACGKVSGMNR